MVLPTSEKEARETRDLDLGRAQGEPTAARPERSEVVGGATAERPEPAGGPSLLEFWSGKASPQFSGQNCDQARAGLPAQWLRRRPARSDGGGGASRAGGAWAGEERAGRGLGGASAAGRSRQVQAAPDSQCPDGGGGGRWPVGVGSCKARAAGAAGAGRPREPRGESAAGSAPQAGRGGGCSRIRKRCWRLNLPQSVPEAAAAAAAGPEIALGTVTNMEEAVKWISYTYLCVRMRANPLVYGISYKAYQIDPTLRSIESS
ncbi:uncharacterized protein ACOB7L_007376 [Callospermophilus lateralis]|uniref:uncharacterized protein LOC143387541 n=1 Tax=Callospermophilus lateralis TaxID=76772 RepID=UPI0040543926